MLPRFAQFKKMNKYILNKDRYIKSMSHILININSFILKKSQRIQKAIIGFKH